MTGLGHRMAKGAAWMVLFKVVERSIGLVSTIILARLLVPADFGLIAMAMVVIAVLETLGSFSFDMALIQNQTAERHHYDTAWTFSVLYALFSAVALVLLAGPTAHFYNDPRLESILYCLAIATFVTGFENIGMVAFRKDLELNKEFNFLITKKLVSFVVTVVLAFTLRNYWALIFGMLASRITGVLLSYFVHPFRPRFSLEGWADLFHFSKWMVINNILLFFYHRSVDLIIGKLSGPRALGLYSIAYEISNLPSSQLVAPITRAVYPGYSKVAADPERLRSGFLKVLALLALVTVPIGTGIAVTSDPIVSLFLGPKWIDSSPLIAILAFYGVIQSLQSNTGAVFLALGKPRILAYLVGLNSVLLVPALAWGASTAGAYGAAWTSLIVSAVLMPVNLLILFRLIQLNSMEYVKLVYRPIVAAVLMFVSVKAFQHGFVFSPTSADQILKLGGSVIIGIAMYILSVLALWKLAGSRNGAEKYMLDKVFNITSKISPLRKRLIP